MISLTQDPKPWKTVSALLLLSAMIFGCSDSGGGGNDDAATESACVWDDSDWNECEWG
jgi:hypothetical protein